MFTKYKEYNLSLIPLHQNTKRPMIEAWSKYSEQLPSDNETELWDKLIHKGFTSVGLVLGKASNIIAVDLDTDDKSLLSLAPLSPVRKRGNTGETRFFKYNKDIKLRHSNSLDILTDGSQTVLPPSIHPDSKLPYVWLTVDTLPSFNVNDLPELTLDWVEKYDKLANKLYPKNSRGSGFEGGRNNWLVEIVTAKRFDGESEMEIVESVYGIDLHKNNPRLFTDEQEGYKASDETQAKMNAWKFVSSVSASLIRKGSIPFTSGEDGALDISILLGDGPKSFKSESWPRPLGTLGMIQDYIISLSKYEKKSLSLGGSLAIGSVVVGNVLKLNNAWSNLYVINVAPSGEGKEAPYSAAKNLLRTSGSMNLLGYGGYKSSVAIYMDLADQRTRIDLVDEAGSLFRTSRDGGIFQADIPDTLTQLWSNSNSIYSSPQAAGRAQVVVENPCISTLFSLQPSVMREALNKSMTQNGFLPRCLIFNDNETPARKRILRDAKLESEIAGKIMSMRKLCAKDTTNLIGSPKFIVPEIGITASATDLLYDFDSHCDDLKRKTDEDSSRRAMISRHYQLAEKIALISGALNTGSVTLSDVEFAIAAIKACDHNASIQMGSIDAENKQESNVLRVLGIIKKQGSISKNGLTMKTRFLKTQERDDIVKSLIAEGSVTKSEIKSGSNLGVHLGITERGMKPTGQI